jgi:dipeptidase E
MRRLLLLSNARVTGTGYLEWAQEALRTFLDEGARKVLFVPYAAVTKSYDRYVEDISPVFADALGLEIVGAHTREDPVAALADVDAVVIGGGNTWMLHRLMREQGLIDAIRARSLGGLPYVGWSAGTNMACPTIMTSNDMVIVDPLDFDALGLIRFQINPHYLHGNPPGFFGETRETRIREYLEVNQGMVVVGLPEGTGLRVLGDEVEIVGRDDALRVFRQGIDTYETRDAGELASFL